MFLWDCKDDVVSKPDMSVTHTPWVVRPVIILGSYQSASKQMGTTVLECDISSKECFLTYSDILSPVYLRSLSAMITFPAVVTFLSNAHTSSHSSKIVIWNEYIQGIFRLVLQNDRSMVLQWAQCCSLKLLAWRTGVTSTPYI